jgi:hypothetical protein
VADSDDDWRVTLSVSHPLAGPPPSSLSQAEEEIRRQVGRGVGVGAGDDQIFLYAGTEAAAGEAERIGRDVLAQQEPPQPQRSLRVCPAPKAFPGTPAESP